MGYCHDKKLLGIVAMMDNKPNGHTATVKSDILYSYSINK